MGLAEVGRRARWRLRRLRERAYGPLRARRVAPFNATAQEVRELTTAGTFARLFVDHDGRRVHKKLHYFSVYERHLAGFRDGFPDADRGRRPLRFLEIGVSHGGSLELWREFLGTDAVIFGIDIDARCARLDGAAAAVRIGAQTDPAFLANVVREMGGLDVVLDDGSHHAKDQRATFDVLFSALSDGGLYIVEDVHTSYYAIGSGGGYRRPGTFIEVAKSLVDGMHAWYHRWPVGTRARRAKNEVAAVCFYDSIVVIEKRHRSRPAVVRTGRPSW